MSCFLQAFRALLGVWLWWGHRGSGGVDEVSLGRPALMRLASLLVVIPKVMVIMKWWGYCLWPCVLPPVDQFCLTILLSICLYLHTIPCKKYLCSLNLLHNSHIITKNINAINLDLIWWTNAKQTFSVEMKIRVLQRRVETKLLL